jgi:hypothetical protein
MTYKITHKNSTVSGTPPTAGDIDVGEIAINAADAEIYTKDANGNIRKFQNTATGTAAGVQFTQSGTGAVQRTVDSKLKDLISVKDFGAVGNGVADDTAAINAALSAGYRIYIPAGTYKTTSTITIPGSRIVIGDGMNTVIKPSSSVSVAFLQSAASQIADLYIDGVNTGASAIAVFCGDDAGGGNSGPTLTRLRIQNFTGANAVGIYIRKALRVVIEQCYVFNNYNGMYVYEPSGQYPTTVWVSHSTFALSGAEGVYINNGYQICFTNCIFESNAKEGLKLRREIGEAYLGRLLNCWFEDNQYGAPARTSKYQLTVDANGGTGGMHLDNVFFVGSAATAKSIYLRDVAFTSLSKVTVPNSVPNGIFADGTSVILYLDNAGYFAADQTLRAGTAIVALPVAFRQITSNSTDDVGTFQATLTCETSGTITLNNATCEYVRHGNRVTVCGQIDVASVSSPVGHLTLGGLPFSVRGDGVRANAAASILAYNFSGSVTQPIIGRANQGTNTITIFKFVSGSVAALAGDVIVGVTICFECTYFTA